MQPRVSLHDYRLTELHVRWIHRSTEVGHAVPKVELFQGPPPEDHRSWFARLDVGVDPAPDKSGYELRVSIAAGLDVLQDESEPYDEAKSGYLAALNGATILYGLIRAEIASLTSNFPGGRYLLPTVYMQEVLKNQSQQASAESPGAGVISSDPENLTK